MKRAVTIARILVCFAKPPHTLPLVRCGLGRDAGVPRRSGELMTIQMRRDVNFLSIEVPREKYAAVLQSLAKSLDAPSLAEGIDGIDIVELIRQGPISSVASPAVERVRVLLATVLGFVALVCLVTGAVVLLRAATGMP